MSDGDHGYDLDHRIVGLAKQLDRRVSITVLRIDRRKTGPVEVSMR